MKAIWASSGLSSSDADESGNQLEDEEEILHELHRYDTLLYKRQEITAENLNIMKQTLLQVENTVSDQQNKKLIAEPREEEIAKTIRSFKTEKSPWADGMTTEVLGELWREAKQDVLDFVQFFWETEHLSWK
ncbi:hypothetical protein R1sor_002625 [Riccia sorocarpa]|uniref:Uncharacterized protein n=1 Tax=Riccia sorocarpa TaxID=122646 RepID=A0ABD3GZB6_9MARC